ncbi:MAG: nucleotide exchange factor GrpE [Bacteroidota bacterium]
MSQIKEEKKQEKQQQEEKEKSTGKNSLHKKEKDKPDIKEETPNSADVPKDEKEALKQEKDILEDKYLRLSAEFDNFRKRTLKEKSELIKTAGEDLLISFLPVIDDLERANNSVQETQDIEAVKEGIHLIYSKFKQFLESKGVKEIPGIGEDFDTDKHEAMSKIAVKNKDQKGKVVDVLQKGYYLNDKVLRYARVVVGE